MLRNQTYRFQSSYKDTSTRQFKKLYIRRLFKLYDKILFWNRKYRKKGGDAEK